MIQRIQTVYLFFVFCLMATLVFIPFSIASWVTSLNTALAVAVAFVALTVIFTYKKRNMQIRACYGMMALSFLIYVLYFIFERNYLPLSEFFQHVRFTVVFPLIACIFLYLAIRGIKKDEKLVRSLNRLR
jgi:hypothetical protein